jgi:hypothetical protein
MNHFRCIGLAIDFKCAKLFYFNVNQGLSLLLLSVLPFDNFYFRQFIKYKFISTYVSIQRVYRVRKIWQAEWAAMQNERKEDLAFTGGRSPGVGRGSLLQEMGSAGPGSLSGSFSGPVSRVIASELRGGLWPNERSLKCSYWCRCGYHS